MKLIVTLTTVCFYVCIHGTKSFYITSSSTRNYQGVVISNQHYIPSSSLGLDKKSQNEKIDDSSQHFLPKMLSGILFEGHGKDTMGVNEKYWRTCIASFIMVVATFLIPFDNRNLAFAITDLQQEQQGVSLITDSLLGKAVRKSTIQGARIIDNLDEKWERYSDSLRDKNKCDENTGRKLFDNGFRRDGVTRIGNPVLGALCNPVALEPLNQDFGNTIIDYGFDSAARVTTDKKDVGGGSVDIQRNKGVLLQTKDSVERLVQPSFERSISNIDEKNIAERKRQQYNFVMYTSLKAINEVFTSSSVPASSSFSTMAKQFYLSWGDTLISNLAPNANRNDYSSPFPETKDEIEDYDYNKNDLLDSLGKLNVALKELQKNGLIGYFEISIPYDDYGSVCTIAVDDDITLGSQLLLREQGVRINGSFVEALVRSVMERATIKYTYDSFFIDPSTTKQSEYNPTQLLISLSNLRKYD